MDHAARPELAAPGEGRWEAQTLLLGRVRDAALRPAIVLEASASLKDAARAMSERGVSCVLVQGEQGLGIVTSVDLRDALALRGHAPDASVAAIASSPVVAIAQDALLIQALVQMDRHRVRRLIARGADGSPCGVLEQWDLLRFLADHSQAVALRIESAERVEDLRGAFEALLRLIASLHRSGVTMENAARLASEISEAIMRRVFELVMPAALRDNACLVVMGSEGRREQVLPTDQDNALVLRDGFEQPELAALCARFSAALVGLGYPPCPGKVMVSNPDWTMSESAFRARISGWMASGNDEAVMNLAIFLDGRAAAGDASLLEALKAHLFGELRDNDAFLARFASVACAFPKPIQWLVRFRLEKDREHAGMLDVKKGGVFPIVHGVRSMALEKRLPEVGTLERAGRLVEIGTLPPRLARDVLDAYRLLTRIRTEAGLEALAAGRAADNYVAPERLAQLDRDGLRDSLRVAMRFRELVRQHFRLDQLGF